MVLEVSCDAGLIVINKFELIGPLFGVYLDAAVAVGTVHSVTGFLIAIKGEIRITNRALVIFHDKTPLPGDRLCCYQTMISG